MVVLTHSYFIDDRDRHAALQDPPRPPKSHSLSKRKVFPNPTCFSKPLVAKNKTKGADINKADMHNFTPLHLLAQKYVPQKQIHKAVSGGTSADPAASNSQTEDISVQVAEVSYKFDHFTL